MRRQLMIMWVVVLVIGGAAPSLAAGLIQPKLRAVIAGPHDSTQILVALDRGFLSYNRRKESWHDKAGRFPQVTTVALSRQDANTLWLGGAKGLYRYQYDSGVVVPDPACAGIDISTIYPDQSRADRLWIGSNNGLYRYDLGMAEPTLILARPGQLRVPVAAITQSPESGQLWVGGSSGLYQMSPADSTMVRVYLPSWTRGQAVEAVATFEGLLLCGGGFEGLLAYDIESGEWMRHNKILLTAAPTENITKIALDPVERNYIWLALRFGGLARYDLSAREWDYYSLPNTTVATISFDRYNPDNIWFAANFCTGSRVVRYRRKSNEWSATFVAELYKGSAAWRWEPLVVGN